jgi:hypothetical protein
MKRTLLFAVLTCASLQPGHADQPLETLRSIMMLRASQEICAFSMDEAQSAKLTHAIERLRTRLGYTAAQVQTVYDTVKPTMTDQKSDLCKPSGDWATTYAAALAGLPD